MSRQRRVRRSLLQSSLLALPIVILFAMLSAGTALLFAGTALLFAGTASASDKKPFAVTATLIPAQSSAQPGTAFPLKAHFEITDGWLIYGPNPGAFGKPTKIELSLSLAGSKPLPRGLVPRGLTRQLEEWPEAEVFHHDDDQKSYGFTQSFSVGLNGFSVPATAEKGEILAFSGSARWLECSDKLCIPRKQEVRLEVPVGAKS